MSQPRILFLVPYPQGKAPSQRFRFEQYFAALQAQGIPYEVQSFMDDRTWEILYKPGRQLAKVLGILRGFLRRAAVLFRLQRYDYVFVHREASPIGPPVFEWLIAKVFGKKLIFDFDDAVWLPNTSEVNKVVAAVKWHHKTGAICRWSYKVSAGNAYLAAYAEKQSAKQVIVNPTTIDMEGLHNRMQDQATGRPAIGWTGSHSTLPYLQVLVPVLQKLEEKHDFDFVVIADKDPQLPLKSVRFVPWNKATERDDLLRFHIGVMPLVDDQWAKGKCGFKALQYMSLGIPAVVSPVGVNTTIVDHGKNGMVAATEEDWYAALATLMQDEALRIQMGAAAAEKILGNYSVSSNTPRFLALFA